MVKSQPDEREKYSNIFESTKGNWDIYIPFIEFSISILKDNGFGIIIAPNKWMSIKYGKVLRELLFKYFSLICILDKINVFEAGNSPVITGFSKDLKSYNITVDEFVSKRRSINKTKISKKIITNNWGILLSDHIDLLKKLMNCNHKISEYFSVENPFTTSEAYEIKNILDDRDKTESDLFLINTGTIDPYVTLWGQKQTSYLKLKLKNPVIKKEDLKDFSNRRYEQSLSPKIIITGMRHFEAFYDKMGEYVAGKSTIIIREKIPRVDLLLLLPILNSKLITFYIRGLYSALGIDGGINFSKDLVETLPIADNFTDYSEKIISYTKNIINAKKANHQADTSNLESKIDQLIYELYGLTEEEIKIIEDAI